MTTSVGFEEAVTGLKNHQQTKANDNASGLSEEV